MTPKTFNYVLSGIFAAVILISSGAYYLASQSLRNGTALASQRMGDDILADKKLADLEDLQQQYRRLQPMIPAIDNALPTQKDQSRIALQLRNIANQSGMALDTLSFSASAAPGPISQTVPVGDVLAIPVTFQLSGTYDQLLQFLDRQEHLERYTSMTSLGITNISGGRLNFDVSLNVFLKP